MSSRGGHSRGRIGAAKSRIAIWPSFFEMITAEPFKHCVHWPTRLEPYPKKTPRNLKLVLLKDESADDESSFRGAPLLRSPSI
jgi:hypothetical protein